jgi:hypothetical protein
MISLLDNPKAGPPLLDYSLLCGRDSLVGSCDRLFLGEALFHQIRQIDFNRLRREFSLVLLTRHVAPDSFDLILIPGGAETRRQRRGVVENYRLSLLAWLASPWLVALPMRSAPAARRRAET